MRHFTRPVHYRSRITSQLGFAFHYSCVSSIRTPLLQGQGAIKHTYTHKSHTFYLAVFHSKHFLLTQNDLAFHTDYASNSCTLGRHFIGTTHLIHRYAQSSHLRITFSAHHQETALKSVPFVLRHRLDLDLFDQLGIIVVTLRKHRIIELVFTIGIDIFPSVGCCTLGHHLLTLFLTIRFFLCDLHTVGFGHFMGTTPFCAGSSNGFFFWFHRRCSIFIALFIIFHLLA